MQKPFLIIIIIIFLQFACNTSAQRGEVEVKLPQRKPLLKNDIILKSPEKYSQRTKENGEKYDPKPRVVLVDKKARKYELRWIGYDGKQKIIEYQRYDAVDVIVKAEAKKERGKFTYTYEVKNLETSSTYLSGFIVQNFAFDIKMMDIKTQRLKRLSIGRMSTNIPQFKKGNWLDFGILPDYKPKIVSGKSVKFSLTSSSLPGIVNCRVTGGSITTKGVGEHMPSELETARPGYEQLPYGYTIGPIDKLSDMSKEERAKYILENLGKFEDSGWITKVNSEIYKSMLKKGNLEGASKKAKEDYAKNLVTSEVQAIVVSLAENVR